MKTARRREAHWRQKTRRHRWQVIELPSASVPPFEEDNSSAFLMQLT